MTEFKGQKAWKKAKIDEWLKTIESYMNDKEARAKLDKFVNEKKNAENASSSFEERLQKYEEDINKKYQETIKKSEYLFKQTELIIEKYNIDCSNVESVDIIDPNYLFYKIEYEIEKYKSYKELSFKDKIKKFFGLKYGKEHLQKIAKLVLRLENLTEFYENQCKAEIESEKQNIEKRREADKKRLNEENEKAIEIEVERYFDNLKNIIFNIGE